MKCFPLVLAVAALLAVATSSNADAVYGDYSTYTMMSVSSANQIDENGGLRAGEVGTLYSNMDRGPNGYAGFGSDTGSIGFEDYDTGFSGLQTLDTLRFVGGVSDKGEILFFDFFDAGGAFVDGFGLSFGEGGNFIYTISGLDAPIGTLFDSAGFLELVTETGDIGEWLLGDAGPSVGTEDPFVGSSAATGFSHNFELNAVPAPSTFALLGLGGLVAARRRR